MVGLAVFGTLIFVFFVPLYAFALGVKSGRKREANLSIESRANKAWSDLRDRKKKHLWGCPDCPDILEFTDQFDLDEKLRAHKEERHP